MLDKNNRVFMMRPDRRERIPVSSGQYLYLAVSKVWVPVLIRYSEQMQKWFFEGIQRIRLIRLLVRRGQYISDYTT